jgi:hypothetical protein
MVAWTLPLAILAAVAVDVLSARSLRRDYIDAHKNTAIELLGERRQPVELHPNTGEGELRVWLFGASSFAAPDRVVFPSKLSARYAAQGRTVVIDNLAWEGFTTADLARRAEQAAEQAVAEGIQPDIVVFYEGHNDVTTTFHAAMGFPAANPWAYPVSALTALPAWVWTAGWTQFPEGGGYRFFRNRRMGALFRLYQQLGLVQFEPEDFTPLVDHILDHYVPNIDRTRAVAASLHADFIVVTPVGNLLMRPYGPVNVIDPLYDAGVAEPDYERRMSVLLQARDAEVFTSDMRTKSVMIDALRQYASTSPDPGQLLQLCDLERALFDRQAPMDDSMFVDPLHFSDLGFEQMADVVFGCLQRWEEARGERGAP